VEVVTHGIRHGAATALAAAHLHSGVDLRAVEPGFPVEAPEDVGELVADFTAAANAILAVVDVEQVVRDAPHRG